MCRAWVLVRAVSHTPSGAEASCTLGPLCGRLGLGAWAGRTLGLTLAGPSRLPGTQCSCQGLRGSIAEACPEGLWVKTRELRFLAQDGAGSARPSPEPAPGAWGAMGRPGYRGGLGLHLARPQLVCGPDRVAPRQTAHGVAFPEARSRGSVWLSAGCAPGMAPTHGDPGSRARRRRVGLMSTCCRTSPSRLLGLYRGREPVSGTGPGSGKVSPSLPLAPGTWWPASLEGCGGSGWAGMGSGSGGRA